MIADILDLDTQRNNRCYSESSGFSDCSSPNSRVYSPGISSPEYNYQMNILSEPVIANNTLIGTNYFCSLPPSQNQNTAIPNYNCSMEILEQPTEKFRFRYISEMHGTHGSLMGEKSIKSRKSFPQVKLIGFEGHAKIRCSLYQADLTIPSPHSHLLVVRRDERDINDPHDVDVSPEKGYAVKFQGMGIIHTAKKDIAKELFDKKLRLFKWNNNLDRISMKEQQLIKDQTEKETKSMNLNQVRLCFEAFKYNGDGTLSKICEPIFSRPINNMKSALTGELKISRLSAAVSSAAGGDDLFLFVEKVGKKNIKVRFFQVNDDDETIWEEYGNFAETDVHHQYAIALRTPQYKDRDIDRTVDVFIQLVRPSDNDRSDPLPFKYKPRNTISSRKRRRVSCSSGSLNSFELPEPIAKGSRGPPPSENGHLTISEDFDKPGIISDILNMTTESGGNYAEFMQMVTNKSDELTSMMDPAFLDPMISLELDKFENKLELDGTGAKRVRSTELKTILEQNTSQNSSLKRIFENFITGLRTKRNLKQIRSDILDIWNDFYGSNENNDDILHEIIAQNDLGNAVKLFKIIEILQIREVLSNQNQRGESSLHIACLYNHPEFIRPLLGFGCNPNLQDSKGNTALHIAVSEDFKSCLKAILSKRDNLQINTTNDNGLTALHLAVKNGDLDAVEQLIRVGKASVKIAISKNGNNALHIAVEQEKPEIVRFLLENTNIKFDQTNSSNFTPLDLAKAIKNDSEIVKMLQSRNSAKTAQNLAAQFANENDSNEDGDDDDSGSEKTLKIDEDNDDDAIEEEDGIHFNEHSLSAVAKILDSNNYWKKLSKLLNLDHLTCLWSSAEALLEHINKENTVKRSEFVEALSELDKSLSEEIGKIIK